MANKKLEPLNAIQSVMMLTDDALSTSEIGTLIQKKLGMKIQTAAIKKILESNPSIFCKLGSKWKINVGVD